MRIYQKLLEKKRKRLAATLHNNIYASKVTKWGMIKNWCKKIGASKTKKFPTRMKELYHYLWEFRLLYWKRKSSGAKVKVG